MSTDRMERPAATDGQRPRTVKPPASVPRRDIQGLRAVAVLAVIADHLFEWPSGGFVGVDVFFVISGFLITGILVRQYERDGTVSARRFYQRRVKRIVPAATLVLVCTVAASFVLLPISRAWTVVWDAVAAFFFVSNWRFAEQGTDYFQQGLPPSPLQNYWSLSVEEQFYFVWPWLMLAVLLVGTRLFAWKREHGRLVAGVMMAAIVAASFGWALYQTSTNPNYAYFSSLGRVWELGVGALIAIAAPWLQLRQLALRSTLAWIGLAGIAASLFVVSASDGFPAPWAALPVLATALVIGAGCGGDVRLFPLTNEGAQYVGNISYSLYLWHFPVIVLLAAVVETETLAFYSIAGVLIVGLSVASFDLVEQPLREATWVERSGGRFYFGEGWKIAGMVAVIIPVAALAAYALMPSHYAPPATSPFANFQAQSIAEQQAEGAEEARCVGAAVMAPGSECALNASPTFYPPVSGMLDDSQGAFDCWIDEGEPMRSCTYGDTRRGALKVALVGDSHAAMLLPALKDSATELGISIDTYTGFGCQWKVEGNEEACPAAPDIREAIAAGNYDAVITQGYRSSSGEDPSLYSDVWAPVAAGGATVIVVADNPEVSEATLDCVRRVGFNPLEDDCATPRADAERDGDVLVEAATDVAGAKVIDLSDYFCAEGACPAVIGDVLVYRDEVSHMTGTFSRSLAPYLAQELEPLLPTG